MSVLIKGFTLPNNCGACPLRLAWCRERIYMVTRPERCPLVPVPKHGDLIDRDALMELYADEDDLRLENMKVPIAVIRQNIMDMPTIIPAEEADHA